MPGNRIVVTNAEEQTIGVSSCLNITVGECEEYAGSYEVTPRVTAQELETENKRMASDVLIHEIPKFEVSNLAGGLTVSIG